MHPAKHPQAIQEIIRDNRLFDLLHEGLKASDPCDPALLDHLLRYTNAYITYHALDPEQVAGYYRDYIKEYNRDVKAFMREGEYPLERDPQREIPGRQAYSIILLLSTLLTAHRFRIMQLICEQTEAMEHGLFIGCGPGIEIELVKGKAQGLTAYDLDIDPFLSHAHPSVDFRNTFFDGSGEARYDTIYLIEILEHLSEPLALIESCKKVLAPNGRLHLTTATNLPQFDHRYNFDPNHEAFEAQLGGMGFETRFKEDIEHAYMTTDIGARNRYYVLGSSGSCAD